MGIPENHPAILQAMERGLIVKIVPPQGGSGTAPLQTQAGRELQAKEAPKPLARLSVSVLISPLKLVSEANANDKLRNKISRKTAVKAAVSAALPELRFPLPCVVVLTRIGGKQLDDDNLQRCFKAVRDVVAKWLGVDDADPRIRWRYRQRPGWVMGCGIQIRENR
jgi:hypothetical protein